MTVFRNSLSSFGKRGALALALGTTAMAGFGSTANAVTYVWTSGNYAPGTTSPNPLMSPDVLQLETGGSKFFFTDFTNQSGTVEWNGGSIFIGGGSTVDNQSLFVASGDFSMAPTTGSGFFVNSGTFRKTAGAGNLTIGSIAVTSSGTIDAQSGTILFNGGNADFLAGSVFMGAGTVAIGSSATFHGGFTASNLLFTNGSHTGDNAALTGTMGWQAGTFLGDWTIESGSVMNATGGANRFVSGGTFTNEGTVNWSGTGGFYFQADSSFVNENLFDITATMSIAPSTGGGTFQNAAGAMMRVSSGNIAFISAGFEDLGGMIVANGQFNFNSSGQSFDGTTFTGTGASNINANGTFNNAIQSDNLDFNNGVFTGVAAVLSGTADWNAGTFAGDWTIASGATMNGLGGSNRFISAAMTNDGTVAWAGSGGLYFQGGGSLINNGDFDATSSMSIANSTGGGTFFNEATGTLSVASGFTVFVNSGFVSNGGTMTADGTFNFNGGTAVFNSGSTFDGSGTNLVSSNAAFNGTINTSNLSLSSGVMTGTGAVLVGTADWTSGYLAGDWTLTSGSSLDAFTGANRFLAGGSFTNDGTVNWLGTGGFYFQGGATFTNNSLFDITTNMSIDNSTGGGTFINAATGTLHVASGSLVHVSSGFVSNGGTITADGTFNFSNGTQTFNDGTTFNGSGANRIVTNASFAGTSNTTNLEFANGLYTGTAAVLNGQSAWSAGTFTGGWTNGPGSTMDISGGANIFLAAGSFTNDGLITRSGSNNVYQQGGNLFINNGTVDFSSDGSFLLASTGGGTSVNNGLIVKSGGTGTTYIAPDALTFNNLGTVDAQTGTIQFSNNFANNGTLTGDGAFRVDGATGLTNNGTIAAGDGIGSLDITGNLVSTGFSVMEFELGSTLSYDQLFISGTAALDGMLSLFCASCTLSVGDSFTLIDSIGNLSGTFSSFSASGFLTGFDYDVIYDYDLDEVRLVVLDAGTPDEPPPPAVPEPTTWMMMISGFALAGGAMRRRRRVERKLVRFAA